MAKSRTTSSMAIAVLATALLARAEPSASPLEARVSRDARKHDFSGTVLVARKGGLVCHRSFGLADRAFGVPASSQTRYKVASITKAFTAVLILQLACVPWTNRSFPEPTVPSLDRPLIPQSDRSFPPGSARVIGMAAMRAPQGKVSLHLDGRVRRVVDAEDIYYLEAQGDETDVRLRAAQRLRDVRSIGEVMEELARAGFVRIHRNYAVNPARVREIRPAASSWEVHLEPPVNKVLPVSRRSVTDLFEAYGPGSG
jgi:LytTr DNA-binding domain/Beta-lactamase